MNREVQVRFCEKLGGGSPDLLDQTFIHHAVHGKNEKKENDKNDNK